VSYSAAAQTAYNDAVAAVPTAITERTAAAAEYDTAAAAVTTAITAFNTCTNPPPPPPVALTNPSFNVLAGTYVAMLSVQVNNLEPGQVVSVDSHYFRSGSTGGHGTGSGTADSLGVAVVSTFAGGYFNCAQVDAWRVTVFNENRTEQLAQQDFTSPC